MIVGFHHQPILTLSPHVTISPVYSAYGTNLVTTTMIGKSLHLNKQQPQTHFSTFRMRKWISCKKVWRTLNRSPTFKLPDEICFTIEHRTSN